MSLYVVVALAASVWALVAVAYFLSDAVRTWATRRERLTRRESPELSLP